MKKFNLLNLSSIMIFLISCGTTTNSNIDNSDTSQDAETENILINTIPGLQPVDVYLNLEKINFQTDKIFSNEYGNSWTCKSSEIGIDYSVEIFSHNMTSVENIRATARLTDMINLKIMSTKQFFKYVASVPFDNNNPAIIASWIDKNFDNDKSTITVSGVIFTILAPTKFVRSMIIEKSK